MKLLHPTSFILSRACESKNVFMPGVELAPEVLDYFDHQTHHEIEDTPDRIADIIAVIVHSARSKRFQLIARAAAAGLGLLQHTALDQLGDVAQCRVL